MLWLWQEKELQHALEPSRALFWQPRTGKTLAAVLSARFVSRAYGLRKFLVVAPMLAGQTTWPDTLREAWPGANVTQICGGSIAKRHAWMGAMMLEDSSRPDVVIVNYEAVAPLEQVLKAWGPEGIIADEIHLIRSAGAGRTRALTRLGDNAKWRRGLSGTPTPRDYSNIYAQYRFLAPHIFGTRQADFRARYLITHPVWKSKVLGYTHLPELQDKMHSIASVVLRSEAFGPDGVQPPIVQDVILPPAARKIYDRLAKEYVLEVEGSETPLSHRLSRIDKMHQLAGGFVYEDGTTWVHRAKLDALLEELADYVENDQPAVIFYLYEAEGAKIVEELRKLTPNVARLSGKTPTNERLPALRAFGRSGGPRYLVIQEEVGSLGIPLSTAATCIFYSHSFKYDTHTQARDRIWKPGVEPLYYVYLRSKGTVDDFYGEVIDNKEDASTLLLRPGEFARALKGGPA
jgi:hypothetical protein